VSARFRSNAVKALALGVLLGGAMPVPAAVADPLRASDVNVSAAPDSLRIGERIRYVITVRHDSRNPVEVTGLDAGPGKSFEVVNRGESSSRMPDGRIEYRVSTELAVFDTGRQRLPGFTVTETRSSGSKGVSIPYRPTSSVVVVSLTDSTMTKLRPAAPPVGPGLPPLTVLLPVVALAALMAAAVFILLRMTLFRDTAGRLIDPSRSARQKLRSLDRQLSKGLPPDEGFEALSNILREFLQHRYRFRAMEQVTQEIAEELENRGVRAREVVLKILLRADFIKFAGALTDIGECRSSLKIAEAFCSGTGEQLDAIAPAGDAPASTTEGPGR
jgi:hypothetical protein